MGAEVISMNKSMITKTWIGGLAVLAAGLVVAGVGVFLMLVYGGNFTQVTGNPNSYQFVPTIDGFFWTTVGVIVLGGVFALVGGIVQFVAWIGALVNSYALPEKTWFTILIVSGVLSFFLAIVGFAGMLAYVIAAPDGEPYRHPPLPAAPRLAPTS
jgi:hypothetical protein